MCIINTAMNYIHGHDCIHNLISSVHRNDIDAQYLRLMGGSARVCWAVHPFTENRDIDYDLVCEDFGYQLDCVIHPWNALNTPELYGVCTGFNWVEHLADPQNAAALQDPEYIYWEWWSRLFCDYVDSDTYFNNILGR